jgi:hypothetical protein
MVQRVSTVSFEGIEALAVDVQVQVAPGLPAFKMVGCQWQFATVDSAYARPSPSPKPAPAEGIQLHPMVYP